MKKHVELKLLKTGVPGLDEVLGGGLPEFSFNLIGGTPGSGKTTLAHQIMFANASPTERALYITVLGEPPLKMLRYQQQYTFFDPDMIPKSVRLLHIGADVLSNGLDRVLEKIVSEVEATAPRLVFVDSFRAVVRRSAQPGQLDLQDFVQNLSVQLTSWEATTFLVGEYMEQEHEINPVFTVADGILMLSQDVQRNSIVRKLHVMKMRGRGQVPGLHTVKLSSDGMQVYPRLTQSEPRDRQDRDVLRKTGIKGLDQMLDGGIPSGYSVMVVGPSGAGKTVLATQFIRTGIAENEPGVIAVFEKRPEEYLATMPGGDALSDLIAKKKLKILYLRPLDLSVDETLDAIQAAVKEIGAKRLVIDSLMGFELALAPSFREDFRESLYRMLGALTNSGVTVILTAEVVDAYDELRLSPAGVSFLTDGIILQRYIELSGELARAMTVVKMRGHAHSKELRRYEITKDGLAVGKPMKEFEHLLVGRSRKGRPDGT